MTGQEHGDFLTQVTA